MVPSINRLLIVGRDEDRPTAGLDQESGDVGEDKEEDDAAGRDEKVTVRLEPACKAAEENVVGGDKCAGREDDEEVLCDVDPLALGLGVQAEATADTDRETVGTDGHCAHPFRAMPKHEERLR